MRQSKKTITQGNHNADTYIQSDFTRSEFEGALRTKGYEVIFEKCYFCPCKSKESAHRNTCKNCGGTGLVFCNPTKTEMIITGIMSDDKWKQGGLEGWGMLDTGAVKVTSYQNYKLSFMDRITIVDATAEHNLIVYPELKDDNSQKFAYTKYDIKSIDNITLFDSETTILTRLTEGTDYIFQDNVILFDPSYNNLFDMCVSIRYVYNPSFHVIDIIRESMTSPAINGTVKEILPVHAIAKRAHLIKDVENLVGNRLLDNSWLPDACEAPEMSKFQRQLRYSTAQTIYDNLTNTQKQALEALLLADSI